jgi:hypothetical protein
MLDSLRPFVSRLVGALVGALAGAASAKLGIVVDPATQASVTTAVVIGAYGVVHKMLDKKLNPGDTAATPATVPKTGLMRQ